MTESSASIQIQQRERLTDSTFGRTSIDQAAVLAREAATVSAYKGFERPVHFTKASKRAFCRRQDVERIFSWLEKQSEELLPGAYRDCVREALCRRLELAPVMRTLLDSMYEDEAIPLFESCMKAAVYQGPEAQDEKRRAFRRMTALRKSIAETSAALADQIDEAQKLRNEFAIDGFPVQATRPDLLLLSAGETNPLFKSAVKGPLWGLGHRYWAPKYWPDTADLLRELGELMLCGEQAFEDEEDALAVRHSGPVGVAGVVRVIDALLSGEPDSWPRVTLTDEQFASMLSVLLRRPPDKPVEPDQVKRARQR
ncbi:hypothetical protein [Ideonella sp. YS5]|uniref:hypothetical protein n=1 Tax=Ideonella sp. YS5 TaxID=3453714 RepID=UPI003EEEFB9D